MKKFYVINLVSNMTTISRHLFFQITCTEKISTGKFTWQSSTFGQDKFFRRSYILFMKKLRTSSKKRKNVLDWIKHNQRRNSFKFYCIVFEKIIEMQILILKSALGFKWVWTTLKGLVEFLLLRRCAVVSVGFF